MGIFPPSFPSQLRASRLHKGLYIFRCYAAIEARCASLDQAITLKSYSCRTTTVQFLGKIMNTLSVTCDIRQIQGRTSKLKTSVKL